MRQRVVVRRRGERVLIRPPTPADRSAYRSAAKASRSLLWPWVQLPEDDAGFDMLLRRNQDPSTVVSLICRIDDGALVGGCNINNIVRGAMLGASIGYHGFVGQVKGGLVTEGVGLVVDHAFSELGLHRLEANIQPDNQASIALVRRLGFRLEGFSPSFLHIAGAWRDHERWAILAGERRP